MQSFNEEIIRQNLSSETLEKIPAFYIFDSINSTNQYLLDHAKNDFGSGCVCLAEQQTAGRGRHGRSWHSPYGSNLYLSLLWEFPEISTEISGLSIAVAIALSRALKKVGLENIQLKWPNDILWEKKKLAGILLEMLIEPEKNKKQVIIGIGLNINMSQEELSNHSNWMDIQTILGTTISKNKMAALILNELILALSQFEKNNLISFLPEWRQLDIAFGKEIFLTSSQINLKGIAMGISDKGELLLMGSDNKIQKFICGEVSLRFASVSS